MGLIKYESKKGALVFEINRKGEYRIKELQITLINIYQQKLLIMGG